MQAAKKHTAVAVVSLALLAALALVGSAGGVLPVKRDREAPTAPTNVRVTSATPTTISLAWDASTDNVGVAFYYVYVDAVRARVSGTTYTATNLQCGQSVGVWIVAYDGALNKSPSAAATVSTAACEDMQAPTPPSGFRQAATSENAVVLAWDDSTDDVGVVGYGVYRNQLLLQSTPAPTADLTGLVCGSTYEYQVDAFDAAGNRSALRSVWVETADCRPSPPPSSGWIFCAMEYEQCTFPGTKEVRYGDNGTFTAPRAFSNSVSCSNGVFGDPVPGALKRCEYRDVGGAPPPPDDPPADPPADRTPPSSPTNLGVGSVTRTSVSLTWSASTDNVGVVSYDVFQNGAKTESVTSTTSTQGSLVCGTSYWFGVEALDAAGNRSTRVRVNALTAACQPPPSSGWIFCAMEYEQCTFPGTKEVRYGDNGTFTAPRVFSNSVSCSNGVFGDPVPGALKRCEYRDVGGAPPPPDDPPDDPPADRTPPSSPTNLGVGSVTRTSVSLTWSASTDNVGVTGYRVYVNGSEVLNPVQPGATVTALVCGTAYTFEVDATDAAGNRSSGSRVTSSTSACATPPSGWTFCANEYDQCRFSGTKDVRYGQGSTFTAPRVFNTTVACTNGVFGDPVPGAHKHCEYRDLGGTPPTPDDPPADRTPPSQPGSLVAGSRTPTSIALSWSPSTDNVGVTGYGLYRAGVLVGTSPTASGIFTGLTCNTNYTLAVDAFDAATNRSTKSTVLIATTGCADTAPPSSPTGLVAANVTQTSLTLNWNASSDNVGVTGYDVYRNGTKMASVTSRTSTQNGLACGTSYWFGVEALDAAGNRSTRVNVNPTTTSCAPPPPPPPPNPSGPITISQGGTYTGNWTSTGSTPAVRVTTSEPVTITNSVVTNLSDGPLIEVPDGAQGNVTVTGVTGHGGNGRFLVAQGFKSITVRNCTLDKTSGIYLISPVASASVTVARNKARNIQTGYSIRQFVQFNRVTTVSEAIVEWNEVVNEYGQSEIEDGVSVYMSSNVTIRNNYIKGGYPAHHTAPYSGAGIVLGDEHGNNNRAYDNQIVDYTNVGIGIVAGRDNKVYNNRIVSDGKMDDGVTQFNAANNGLVVWDAYGDPNMTNNDAWSNTVGFMHYGNPAFRNDWWLPKCSGSCSNTSISGTITHATELAEWDFWLAKLAANGISVGA